MKDSVTLGKIRENIESFLVIIEGSREEKQLIDKVISLTMVYNYKIDDCEILMNQVGGRVGRFSRVNNNGQGTKSNSKKTKIAKRYAKKVRSGINYFMGRINKALKTRKFKYIILEHNYEQGVTDLYLGYSENDCAQYLTKFQ